MEEINQFCQMYCTERVSVDLPGAIYVLFIREVGEYLYDSRLPEPVKGW